MGVTDTAPTPTYGTVERVESLSSDLVRVVLGGPGLAGLEMPPFTDAYVNLLFVPPGAPYAVPYDVQEARRLDRDLWPVPRRFSVRRWDAAAGELLDRLRHPRRLRHGGPLGGDGAARGPGAVHRPQRWLPTRTRTSPGT